MDGVSFHAHHFGFDQGRALATARTFASFMSCVVNLAGIRAVNDHARDAVGNSSLGKIFYSKLHVRRCRITPEIVLNKQHQAKTLDRRKVDAFIRDPGRLAAIADVSHDRDVVPLKACP